MSLKYMGVPDYCKHGNYEDKCVWCENERLEEENERLRIKLGPDEILEGDYATLSQLQVENDDIKSRISPFAASVIALGRLRLMEELMEELRKAGEIT